MRMSVFLTRGAVCLCLSLALIGPVSAKGDKKLRVIPPQAAAGMIASDEADIDKLGREVSQIARRLGGVGNFKIRGDKKQKNNSRTLHSEQRINGLRVYGAGLVVNLNAKGQVSRVAGGIADKSDLPRNAVVRQNDAATTALALQSGAVAVDKFHEKAYVVNNDREVVLAWRVVVDYVDERGPQRDAIFVDATVGDIAAVHPQHLYAMSLQTRDCNQTTTNCSLVATTTNAINTGDLAIDSAHNYARATYLYYFNEHGRDSMDDNGMTMRSRVHYDSNYNNAFWDGYQMTYGDGDGTTFVPLSQDADVVAHELTHGVTGFTSGLIYSNESGALNEAFSDIFGAMVDRQEGATGADIWLIGEDIYTPGTPGDALRSMADPAAAGDFDYYPTRYVGSQDNGGVHWNSGIANLAFVLLVEGGSHPRGRTSTVVPGIGFDAAADIFYRANTQCLSPSSNFEAARACTADFATSLYSQAVVDAVHLAWDAVGVPGGPPDPNAVTALDERNLSGSTGSERRYSIEVPEGATDLEFQISGGSGDADLYVRFGAEATSASYDCRPYLTGNSETCSFASVSAGTYHVMIRAYAAYSGVQLRATYVGSGEPQNEAPVANFNWSATGLTVSLLDGSSDADGSVVGWTWSLGDQSVSVAQNPAHTYGTSGSYDVSLVVEDNEGALSATSIQTVTVLLDEDGDSVADESDLCLNTPPGEPVDDNGCGASQLTLVTAIAQSNLSGAAGSEQRFSFTVPEGSSDLQIEMSGGTGDADLYYLAGSTPTQSDYSCRPYSGGNNEVCAEPDPAAGTHHVMVRGYNSFSGVSLTASYITIGQSANQLPAASFSWSSQGSEVSFTDSSSDPDGSVAGWSWNFGDGSTSNLQNPVHTYAGSGEYAVVLTVVDNQGASSSESSQTVTLLLDDDGDGVPNSVDQCLNTPASEVDAVNESGCGPSERDSDGDGVPDATDSFPDDPSESVDSDGDGLGDNADVFPNDASETVDSDGDGVGDNGDAFPNDALEAADSDGDGVGDNADAFPNDPSETTDSDGDGVGDSADACAGTPVGDQVDSSGCTVQPPQASVDLSVTLNNRGNTARLRWSGAQTSRVLVYRSGVFIKRTRNDGAWNDKAYFSGASYEVCEDTGSTESICSNPASP